MITRETSKYLGRLLNIGHFYFGFHPFFWDRKRQKLCMNTSLKYKFLYVFHLLEHLLFQTFVVTRCIQTVQSDKETGSRKVLAVYITLTFAIFSFNHHTTINHYDFFKVVNAAIVITRSFRGKYGYVAFKNGAESKRSARFVKLAMFTCLFVSMTSGIPSILSPNQPQLLSSLAENPDELPLFIKLLCGCIHFHITAFHSCLVFTYLAITVCYVYAVLPMIRRMRVFSKNAGSLPFRATELSTRDLCKYYTQLGMLQNHFNSKFSGFILGVDVGLTYMSVMNLAQAVIYSSARSAILGISMLGAILQAFSVFGQVHEVSNDVLVGWKFKTRAEPWFRKYRVSSRSLKVTIGSFFFIDSGFILTIFQIILSKTVDIIVTYKVE